MSRPFNQYRDKVQGAINEVTSGISSLNMPPDPIACPLDDTVYISELDYNVKHSIEHFRHAIKLMARVYRAVENYRYIYRIVEWIIEEEDLPGDIKDHLRGAFKHIKEDSKFFEMKRR